MIATKYREMFNDICACITVRTKLMYYLHLSLVSFETEVLDKSRKY